MVLIVEDDAVSRRALQQLLRISGFDTIVAASAEEAEMLIEDSSPPDVALVDLGLPGKSGTDFIGWLEVHAPETSPVLVTCESGEDVRRFCRQHPCSYLRKPIEFQTLLQMVRSASPGLTN